MVGSVAESSPSEEMHHIVSIENDRSRRMDFDNWLAVCKSCHDVLEGDETAGMEVKKWSRDNYVNKLNEGLG
jgi:hypothetical protein